VIERVNQKLPDGKKWLANAELVARQLKNFFDGTADVPRITKHMRLPAFRYAPLQPYTWAAGPKVAAPTGEPVRAPTPPSGPPARSWHLRK
jgi:hypothetical protein